MSTFEKQHQEMKATADDIAGKFGKVIKKVKEGKIKLKTKAIIVKLKATA